MENKTLYTVVIENWEDTQDLIVYTFSTLDKAIDWCIQDMKDWVNYLEKELGHEVDEVDFDYYRHRLENDWIVGFDISTELTYSINDTVVDKILNV